MIIEDNKEMKAELISFLGKYGYNAYGPDDFENIVEMALKDDADLILLDIKNHELYEDFINGKAEHAEANDDNKGGKGTALLFSFFPFVPR